MINPDSEKNDNKWGFKDTKFYINDNQAFFKNTRYPFMRDAYLPNFIPYVEEVMGISNLIKNKNPEVKEKFIKPPVNNKKFIEEIKRNFKNRNYSIDDNTRLIHSHGQMTTEEIYHLLYYGKLSRYVDLVFFPYQENEVEKLVNLATKHKVCLVPYGGGTSVSGTLMNNSKEKRMIVSVDMRFMNKILWIDKENLSARIEAGIVGKDLEELLIKQGFTMGHEPDSSEFSTLGGWIATHASGMKRNKYGNIEDIIKSYNLITPKGKVLNKNDFDRSSIGMDLKKMIFGNEGNLGIITQATVKIHPYPKLIKFSSVLFPNFDTGVSFLKELSQTNYIPASVRLVDNVQFRFGYALKEKNLSFKGSLIDFIKKLIITKVKKFDLNKMCLLTLLFEGNDKEVKYQYKNNYILAKKYLGINAGEENGKRGYILTNMIGYIRDFLSEFYIIGETFETTAQWSKIKTICEAVKTELTKQHKIFKLPGLPYINWRITQIYHSDVCIYFTMALYVKDVTNADLKYSKIEKKVRNVVIENGGSISHHHGIGKIRKEFIKKLYTKTEINLIKSFKKSLDPNNIFGIGNNIFP